MYTFSNFGVEYQTIVLKNKSKIYLLKRKGAPIQLQVCIKAGSRYNHTPGLAHFLEHMLVAGTRSYPSKLDLTTALEKVGGNFEAITDADFIRITLSVSQAKHIPLAASILNEMLTASLYREDVFANEKAVILREQKDRNRNISLLPMDILMERVYPDFELHFKGLGTAESVSELRVQDVIEFATNNITAERTSYIVSGDVEMPEIETLIASIKLPEGKGNVLPDLLIPSSGKKIMHKTQEGENSDVLIGFRSDTDSLLDVVGLQMIQQMFMGRGSKLIQELRYMRGLVYSGGVPLWDFTKTSVFGIRTNCAADKLTEVFDVIDDILKQINLNGISELECENIKVKMDSHQRFNLQTSKEWINAEVAALRHNVDGVDNLDALTMLSLSQQMDAKFLTEVFRKYINMQRAYCVVLGPVSEDYEKHIIQALQ